MCGIAGFNRAERSSIPDGRKFARIQALTIESRGRHATGFGWTQRKDTSNVWYAKRQGAATEVAKKLPLDKGIQNLMAHTRHATKGTPRIEHNNHPVVSDHIVAVHNGRVDNDTDLLKLANVENPGEVDSFAFPAMLSRQHELAADHPTDLLELVQGVAAVAWIDANENDVLHLARLSTRPLWVGWTKRQDLVFASTAESLRRTARLAGVAIEDLEQIDEGTYLRVERGQIEDIRFFTVNHPPVLVAEDMPKAKRAKARNQNQKPLPAFDAADGDWWAEYDRREAERYEQMQRDYEAAIRDAANDIDWDTLAPRRGWKV